MGVQQLGVYWPFKTLLQGAGISITEDATTMRISATGGGSGGGGGDMLQSEYAPSGIPGKVDDAISADNATNATHASTADSVPWSGISGAPTSFPTDWSLITSKPTVFPPATHGPTHRGTGSDPIGIADTTDSGLLALLSGKATDFVGGDNQCHDLPSTMQKYGALPPGTVMAYAGATLPGPTGTFFFCQGQAVSRTTYAALYAAIGVTYGSGDGSSTFNLPDMRSRSPICAGQGAGLTARGLGAKGGEEIHTLALSEIPSHAHTATVSDPGHLHQLDQSILGVAAGNLGAWCETGKYKTSFAAATGISVAIAANGGGGAHNNMAPWIGLNYIIKT